MQDHIHAKGPGLLGAAGPVHRQVPIVPGLQGDAHHLAVQHPQDDAGVLADVGHKVQHTLQLPFGQETRRAVGALIRVYQVAGLVQLTALAPAHVQHAEHQRPQRPHAQPQALGPGGPVEHSGEAGEEIGVRERGRRPIGRALRLPHLIVIEELGEKTAAIEQGGGGDGQGDQKADQFLTVDGGHSPQMLQSRCTVSPH